MGLRIISGSLKGRKIASLPGTSTRPTSNMVREAIFNVISDEIKGSCFLELYAGTGAVGIEAVSRGAERAVLIEGGKDAADLVRKNINACGIESRVKLIKWDIEKNLNCLDQQAVAFDMVFLDPPYEKGLVRKTLDNLLKSEALSDDALVIVQHSKNEALDLSGMEESFSLLKDKRYGKNLVSYLRYQK